MACNTKAYLLSLLFLFLLLHTSVAIPRINLKTIKTILSFGKLAFSLIPPPSKNPTSPPSPPFAALPPSEEIRGLESVKEYLNSYGYFPDSGKFTDALDQQAKSSIEEYQQFFNLSVTGNPDGETLQHMSLLRCGVPDKNLTYDIPTDSFSWPLGTKWFPNGRRNLTYGFAPENELDENVTKVFKNSFKRWSDAIGVGVLNLTETTSYDAADIKIGFYTFKNDTLWPQEVGASLIELESSNDSRHDVTSGYMILVAYDGNMSWALPTYELNSSSWDEYYSVVDLETVVMHQIGHLLGLEHSSNQDSVMHPVILPSMQRKVNLTEDDKDKISEVDYSGGISGHGSILFGSTTLSLGFGFACVLLFI